MRVLEWLRYKRLELMDRLYCRRLAKLAGTGERRYR